METVKIEENVRQKFIILETVKGDILLCGDASVTWHKDILENMEKDGLQISAVKGGGWIYPEMASRTIYVWDRSTRFGEANFSIVKDLLNAYFLDFKILNEEPSGACG
jgi:hypothetical protein